MPKTLYDPTEIEYLDGLPHPKVSPRYIHGRVQFLLAAAIQTAAQGRGEVITEVRFDLGAGGHAKTEMLPDVAYLSLERSSKLSGVALEKPTFAPDIAAEIRSPSDDLKYLAEKIARYLATGAILVLDVDPDKRRIIAHSADGVRTFASGEVFQHPAVPWLTFCVDRVFTPQQT